MATPTLVRGARASRTTVSLKILMAGSGIIFILFVLLHMYGNLKAFGGETSFNVYAEHLRTIGEPMLPREGLLWVIRAVLIVSLVVHVWSAAQLWKRSNAARTQKYAVKKNTHSSFSSRTMRWGGVTILLFLIWHLINFTIGKVNPAGGPTNNPYELLVDSFSTWWVTVIYLVAMAALALHLHHGTFSSLQTLGFTNSAAARKRARAAGWVVAVVIAGGFSLVPLFTLFGVIDY
ncbi:succinate dehydrogenase cytochrome b subunit [Nocardioides acrostichi]|uniref:Succinate dehydrogenase cytochrome b subunit n=1 Tax=Nocardioides acrostichi TaxID=2784339 RepID=A0A930UVR7_9ACTN|nr:succinate dehydrogenase cytochrome b subunit [Nocardioides acrostichi]MBF4161758.1 succinate dehydrogenase cytochrome b subunit [Nocardioides acrostichi]